MRRLRTSELLGGFVCYVAFALAIYFVFQPSAPAPMNTVSICIMPTPFEFHFAAPQNDERGSL
jgi:hypothetical protein